MDTIKEFKCDRCEETSKDGVHELNLFFKLLFIIGLGYWPSKNQYCKDCSEFLNLISFIFFIFIISLVFVVIVILCVQ